MRSTVGRLAALLALCLFAGAIPVDQIPLQTDVVHADLQRDRPSHGRFLHISDLHPDPLYKYHSSVSEEEVCHGGKGPAGYYGAETTSCDSPFTLINQTFEWIDKHLKDNIDFVIWTGDSARHDEDERYPRDVAEVEESNRFCVGKFMELFAKEGVLHTPVVPTWGNNDILPHNIFYPGPNRWTKAYLDIWRPFIPESQRHGFEYGGWFWSEVVPNKLAVLSLNSLYFADNNAAVNGCADRSEPGYAQFEWLRIQLQSIRNRGMKAIIMGHQAPARTESKQLWDETCWQKYTLWLYQFRDIIVGTTWGHMNIDHFMIQDIKDVSIKAIEGKQVDIRTTMEDEISTQGVTDYLTELRQLWHKLPSPPKKLDLAKNKKKRDKFHKKIGGAYGERYSLSLVSPSVVPNYFPTLRIVEYNVSGLDAMTTVTRLEDAQDKYDWTDGPDFEILKKGTKIPRPPSKSTPPGPAYSPQTFTWLKYIQYYSNLTVYNNDFATTRWKPGKHKDKVPESSPDRKPKRLEYRVEYDTAEDGVYQMKDLTVLSYLKLAEIIGKYKPVKKADRLLAEQDLANEHQLGKKHDRKKRKHKEKKKLVNKVWHAFIRRAFVGAIDDKDLEDQFGTPVGHE